jgi:hypothetical protein
MHNSLTRGHTCPAVSLSVMVRAASAERPSQWAAMSSEPFPLKAICVVDVPFRDILCIIARRTVVKRNEPHDITKG